MDIWKKCTSAANATYQLLRSAKPGEQITAEDHKRHRGAILWKGETGQDKSLRQPTGAVHGGAVAAHYAAAFFRAIENATM